MRQFLPMCIDARICALGAVHKSYIYKDKKLVYKKFCSNITPSIGTGQKRPIFSARQIEDEISGLVGARRCFRIWRKKCGKAAGRKIRISAGRKEQPGSHTCCCFYTCSLVSRKISTKIQHKSILWNTCCCFNTWFFYKHRKNCECCPLSLLIVRWQRLLWKKPSQMEV